MTYSPGNGGTGLYVEDETNVGVGTTLTNGQKLFVAKIDDDLIGIATVRVGLGTTGTFYWSCCISQKLFDFVL